jgi:hypothetical protein
METLPSGLSERVVDEEDLARFLTSSSQFNSEMAKPSAFLPETKTRETSVFRHGSEPRENLWAIGQVHVAQGRNIHGAAIIKARDVRISQLEVAAYEPPPRHAAIKNWPWIEYDPELRKAQQKELANLLASKAVLVTKQQNSHQW